MAIALPNFIKIKDKAKEAEVKQNLHAIQLAIERYATDMDGNYPFFLFGGEGLFNIGIRTPQLVFRIANQLDELDKGSVKKLVIILVDAKPKTCRITSYNVCYTKLLRGSMSFSESPTDPRIVAVDSLACCAMRGSVVR